MVVPGMEIDHKELVVELLEAAQAGKERLTMLELRLTLFVAAVRHSQDLTPFPPCFFDPEKQAKDLNGIYNHIRKLPPLEQLTEETDLEPLTWELLYWVFTNPLTISPLFNFDMVHAAELVELLELHTGLKLPPGLDKSAYFIFSIKNPNPKPAFIQAKEKYGSYFAFHGSPLHNFHSIIHRGLLRQMNRLSAYGVGTYLASDHTISDGYARVGNGWEKSLFGEKLKAMLICEVVNAWTGLTKHNWGAATVTVVSNDDLLQVAYLLVFAPEFYFYN